MTIYSCTKYTKFKQEDTKNTASLNSKELYDFIATRFGWKKAEKTEYDNTCLTPYDKRYQFLDDNGELKTFTIWFNEDSNEFIAQTIELNSKEKRKQTKYLLLERLKEEYKQQNKKLSDFLTEKRLNCDLKTAHDLYIQFLEWSISTVHKKE